MSARVRGRVAAIALVASISASGVAGAAPADVDEARKHYARGVQLYEQGADAAALAELERAYELAPNWSVLYDLALVELQVHDFAAALRYFERYLADGKDGVNVARRRDVEARIAQLREDVATIEVHVADGAAVTLDDVAVGTAPLPRPLVVNRGHYKVGATKDGRVAESRLVSAAGGDHVSVDLVIPEPPPVAPPVVVEVPTATAPAAPPSHETARERAPIPLTWVGWVAAGALASAAIVTGLDALNASSDLTRAKNDGPASAGDLAALSSRARGFAIASDVLLGAALVTGGVTLYFTLRPARDAPPAPKVGVDLGPGSVWLKGTF